MIKRFVDIVLSGVALLVFLPFGLVIALVLRFSGEGEVFYLQRRSGRGGKEFNLIKFATMLKNSPNIGTGVITVREDPRVLPVGRFLRKTKLNEMPQIINILKGDMSIVGPRPLVPGQFNMLPEGYRDAIKGIRPGLTGMGSLVFRDEEKILSESPKGHEKCYREDIMPLKMKLELWYAKHASFRMDCLLIVLTAWVVIFPESAVHRKVLGPEWNADLTSVLGKEKH